MTTNASRQGEIYLHRGNLTQAQYWYAQAVDEARAEGTWDLLASALGNLGNVYALMEDFHQADTCYQEVLTIQRTQSKPNTIGETLGNLGNLKADAGDYSKARAYYLEAIDALTATDNHRGGSERVCVRCGAFSVLVRNLDVSLVPPYYTGGDRIAGESE